MDSITIEISSRVWTQQYLKDIPGEWFVCIEKSINGRPLGNIECYGPFVDKDVCIAAKVKFESGEAIAIRNLKTALVQDMLKING